eukprot:CAMPEP_0113850876 /NCGR_PEP_ID=MMETSP0372-20130328/4205_1 /TAXON_ID=340204 /ORGANISM="Lankesteria abbotti" /LENGTH=178 /DNA_ID=CAMNT_0000821377 /DNA_START=6 /DNA_END=542 /DNA_ORIENTATION=+ /assembly_acc=CAM_ASM_000359
MDDGVVKMDFELFSSATILLRNGGHFFVAAGDVVDAPPKDPSDAFLDLAMPYSGAVEHFLLASSEMFTDSPRELKYHFNVGKGGRMGTQYMVEPAVEMLQKFNPNLKADEVVMVGDNFGTDIAAANDAGAMSILVLSGVHQLKDAVNWDKMPTCYLDTVGELAFIFEPSRGVNKHFIS